MMSSSSSKEYTELQTRLIRVRFRLGRDSIMTPESLKDCLLSMNKRQEDGSGASPEAAAEVHADLATVVADVDGLSTLRGLVAGLAEISYSLHTNADNR